MERDLSIPARAVGDPARARMLSALVGGARLATGDLARVAGVAPSTASEHLGVLRKAGIVVVEQDGRLRRHSLAGPEVARALEALQAIAPQVPVRSLRGRRIADELVAGRTCYDHLAGDLGLRLADLLVTSGVLAPLAPGEVQVGPRSTGHPVVRVLRLDALPAGRRAAVRGCLDWSGRRAHVAGVLGAHLLDELRRRDWLVARPGSRAVALTSSGSAGLADLEADGPAPVQPRCSAWTSS